MGLTKEQRAELEALGPETVRMKLIQPGAGRWNTTEVYVGLEKLANLVRQFSDSLIGNVNMVMPEAIFGTECRSGSALQIHVALISFNDLDVQHACS